MWYISEIVQASISNYLVLKVHIPAYLVSRGGVSLSIVLERRHKLMLTFLQLGFAHTNEPLRFRCFNLGCHYCSWILPLMQVPFIYIRESTKGNILEASNIPL